VRGVERLREETDLEFREFLPHRGGAAVGRHDDEVGASPARRRAEVADGRRLLAGIRQFVTTRLHPFPPRRAATASARPTLEELEPPPRD
jgi:hypothetical protein